MDELNIMDIDWMETCKELAESIPRALLKEDWVYEFTEDRRKEMEHLLELFSSSDVNRKWHIIIFDNNKIKRVDHSWMN